MNNMHYKPFCLMFLLVLLLSACTLPSTESGAQEETIPAEDSLFADYIDLPSDGLAHDPYGWDSLYGSKEVPEIWWRREPGDPIAEESTCITIAASKSLEGKEIWISLAKNGEMMEPIVCQRRAVLQADGIEKTKYCGYIQGMSAGDQVEYMICAGEKGIAEKALGPFSFHMSSWSALEITGATKIQQDSATYIGKVGSVEVALHARVNPDGTASIQIENGEDAATDELPLKLTGSSLSLAIEKDASLRLLQNGQPVVSWTGIEALTDGEAVYALRLTVQAEETDRFYGFGMKYDALDQRGNTVQNYCVNWYQDQNDKTYTPVPYYFVPNRYGLFVDSTYYSSFSMCTEQNENTCIIEVDAGGAAEFTLPVYLFAGNNAEIAAGYAKVAGKAELPPVWAFGPWISANEWNRQSEILEQMNATLEHEIATSVIVIEAWSDEQTFYTFNDSQFETAEPGEALRYQDFTFSGRWPDPKGMVQTLHQNDIKCLLWQIPVLKYSTEATAQSIRDRIYAESQGYVLRYEDGSTYRLPGGTWFGNSLLLDFTNEEAVRWFLEKRRYLLEEIGIDGFKTDGGEFVWGRDIVASDGTRGDELRNAYPDQYAQAYYDFSKQIVEESITFSRAGGSAMQQHPLCWVGDQSSDSAAFEDAIRATLSANMSGIPFVAWDIAGFSGDVPAAELYQRSVAQAAFSSVMQVHSETAGDPEPSQARTPWNMALRKKDDACLDTYRYYANLRMNLLPYIYTEAKWSSETGEPLMRSMAYAYPDDLVAAGYEFQYLFGRNMLVAPVTNPSAKSLEVYLPEGVWYDFFTGKRYAQGVHTIEVALDEIPVFVREGTIVPVNTDETGAIATYVGNGTEQYHTLGYLVFPGEGDYLWYDYVNHRDIHVSTDGTKLLLNGQIITEPVRWMGVSS